MGNMNWDNCTTCYNENHYDFEFIECLRDNFLFQHISEPTRYRENQTSNLSELIITNDQNDIENINILPSLGVSDHVLIKFHFLCKFKEFHNGKPQIKYGKCDFVSFTNEWNAINWDEKFVGHIGLMKCGIYSLNCTKAVSINMFQNIYQKRVVNRSHCG